jgi:phenylpyruvate tautomerase PptA (4-oxalocrotonate tautomerase family)
MPSVRISVPAKVTDAMVEAEKASGARQFTWVLVDEVSDAGWGIAGKTVTLANTQASLGYAESAG